uniref:Uncharacterized protein n=1 Tax=Echeneis naucrates TaxID=173247 RepID=A0A665TTM1_ECHNA
MLISLEKERLQSISQAQQNQEKTHTKKDRGIKGNDSNHKVKSIQTRNLKLSQFPFCHNQVRQNPAKEKPPTKKNPTSFSLSYSISAHKLPISCVSLHPQKLILASASDDCSWRLHLATELSCDVTCVLIGQVGQMLLTGEGHSDWLSGCCFHPDGSKLATTSGDTTSAAPVRLWDFSKGCCVCTLSIHSQPTWSCSFHSCGHFLASCSADKTARVWDLNSQCRGLTLRGHTASVNSVCFLPFSDLLLTCSSDKTLTLWDTRLGVSTTSINGHLHPCNHAAVSLAGDVFASCDYQGVVNLWDVRKLASAVATVDAGPFSTNQVVFSPSGKMLAVACSDSSVRLVEVDSCAINRLAGHRDVVQSVTFDHTGETVMSSGNDGLINMWLHFFVQNHRNYEAFDDILPLYVCLKLWLKCWRGHTFLGQNEFEDVSWWCYPKMVFTRI